MIIEVKGTPAEIVNFERFLHRHLWRTPKGGDFYFTVYKASIVKTWTEMVIELSMDGVTKKEEGYG